MSRKISQQVILYDSDILIYFENNLILREYYCIFLIQLFTILGIFHNT